MEVEGDEVGVKVCGIRVGGVRVGGLIDARVRFGD